MEFILQGGPSDGAILDVPMTRGRYEREGVERITKKDHVYLPTGEEDEDERPIFQYQEPVKPRTRGILR